MPEPTKDDAVKKAAEEVKTSAEIAPIVEGVENIAKAVVERDKKTDDRLNALDTKVERMAEDLTEKTNAGFESMADRLERMSKRTSYIDTVTKPTADSLREVVSKSVIEKSRSFEAQSYHLKSNDGVALSVADPLVHMATNEWLFHATRAQHRRYAGRAADHAQKADALYKALQEVYYGSAEIAQKADLAEDADATGGYLVPTILESDVLRLIADAGKVWPLCRPVPMNSVNHKMPNEASAVTVNWIEEGDTLTAGDPTFGETALIAEKLVGRSTMSVELVQDSAVGLLQWLLAVFSEKMAGQLDYQMVLGDGSGPQITGVMNGSGINALTSATAAGRSLTWALICAAFTGAGEDSARDDGVWLMSHNGYAQCLALTDDNGMPIIHFGTASREAPAGTILGRPIVPSARLGGGVAASSLDDVTNTATKIVFGPPKTLLAGTRMGMSWDVSDQVNWASFQMDARLVGRFAGNVGVPAAWTYLGQVAY